MILVGGGLGRLVALALLGDDVDEDRPFRRVAHVLQHRQEVLEIVPVDRADIVEAELLEQRAAGDEAARVLDPAGDGAVHRLRQVRGQLLAAPAHVHVGAPGDETGEIGAHAADGRGDRHVVVVEDDDQPLAHAAGIVHRLVGHAGRHRAVADDGDHVVVAARQVARHGHAEAGRDRGRGMRRAERVVLALGALGEAREPAALAQRADAVAPAGQDLVRIGLVADVPDQPVVRRVEDVVQRHRQLDHAEAGAEMAAGHRYGLDRLLAELGGELGELGVVELPQILGAADLIEKRFG